MATRKQQEKVSGSPDKRSFREQLEPFVPPPQSEPKRNTPRPRAEMLDSLPVSQASFRELIDTVEPIAAANERLPLDHLPPETKPQQVRLPPRPKLWVEEDASGIRGLADGVSRKACQDLELGRIVPRRELDLHRLSAAVARQSLGHFIAEARQANIACVIVLVGRGSHSGATGPVLPDVVVQHLAEVLAGDILAISTAPRKWGGRGALLVLLQPRSL